MKKTIGIIGLGTIGTAIARGLRARDAECDIMATRRTAGLELDVRGAANNVDLLRACRMVLLCVKPQQMQAVLDEIAPAVTSDHTIVSTCAGVGMDPIEHALSATKHLARAMPNVPCEINSGVTAVAYSPACGSAERDQIRALFAQLGAVVVVDERHFDAVTAISGCGPAYVCVIIEALTDAGVKQGLPRETARLLVAQTVLGSADLVLQSHMHPAQIRDRVTTPGGCTIDALTALEDGKVRHALITAVGTAAAKSSKLSASPQ